MIPWVLMWIILKVHNNKGALLMWPAVKAQLSCSVERRDPLVFFVCVHLLCHGHDVEGWKSNSNLAVFSGAIVVVETQHLIFLTLWWRGPEPCRAPPQCVCLHCVFTRPSRLPRVVLLPRVLLCLTWRLFTLFTLLLSPALSCPELHLTPVFFSKPDSAWQRELILSGRKLDTFNTSVWCVCVLSFAG